MKMGANLAHKNANNKTIVDLVLEGEAAPASITNPMFIRWTEKVNLPSSELRPNTDAKAKPPETIYINPASTLNAICTGDNGLWSLHAKTKDANRVECNKWPLPCDSTIHYKQTPLKGTFKSAVCVVPNGQDCSVKVGGRFGSWFSGKTKENQCSIKAGLSW